MVLKYAFVQKGLSMHCYLLRNDGKFEKCIIGTSNILHIQDEEFWKKWKAESAYCDGDVVDFMFIIPRDTRFPYRLMQLWENTVWNKNNVARFFDAAIGMQYVRGKIPSDFHIGKTPYKLVIYRSKTLPEKNQ